MNAYPDILDSFDHHFASNLLKICKLTDHEGLYWLLALVSKNATAGHVFLDLKHPNHLPEPAQQALNKNPNWLAELKKTPLVGMAKSFKPLVLEGHKLYLRRYWDYEQRLQSYFAEQSGQTVSVDESILQAGLDKLFEKADKDSSEKPDEKPDSYRQAAEKAVRYRLSIIVGGPGSGKTTLVLKILSLWHDQQIRSNKKFRCALVAPVGKAAHRMHESLLAGMQKINVSPQLNPQLKEALASNAITSQTVHRLLGMQRFSNQCSYNAKRLLPFDALVVDESSMLDLSMLCKLTSALHKNTQLLLLGDHNQLPSVEAGSVLHDICNSTTANPLQNQVSKLSGSYRFSQHSPIKKLSELCLQGLAEQAWQLLQKSILPTSRLGELSELSNHEIGLVSMPDKSDKDELKDELKNAIHQSLKPFFKAYLSCKTPAEGLQKLKSTLLLCALRKGPYGVNTVNRYIENKFFNAPAGVVFYAKKAVLVSRNMPELNLSNGDLGICWPTNEGIAVFFEGANGLNKHSPADLPACDTAFALTVHKAQGSEFDAVHCVLPDQYANILTRQLLYTAITRAKRQFILYSNQAVFEQTVNAEVKRNSGLAEWNLTPKHP